jgi:hypothetical protein
LEVEERTRVIGTLPKDTSKSGNESIAERDPACAHNAYPLLMELSERLAKLTDGSGKVPWEAAFVDLVHKKRDCDVRNKFMELQPGCTPTEHMQMFYSAKMLEAQNSRQSWGVFWTFVIGAANLVIGSLLTLYVQSRAAPPSPQLAEPPAQAVTQPSQPSPAGQPAATQTAPATTTNPMP